MGKDISINPRDLLAVDPETKEKIEGEGKVLRWLSKEGEKGNRIHNMQREYGYQPVEGYPEHSDLKLYACRREEYEERRKATREESDHQSRAHIEALEESENVFVSSAVSGGQVIPVEKNRGGRPRGSTNKRYFT